MKNTFLIFGFVSYFFSTLLAQQNDLKGYVLRMNSPKVDIEENQWNYIAIVKDGFNGGKIYKNGQLTVTGTFQDVNYSWSRLDLGAEYYTSYSGWFKGWIDEVRISNRERNANEISSYFNTNSSFKADANTIGLWHLDEISGLLANSNVGNNGTVVNAQWVPGKFGNSLYFNGTDSRASMNVAIPTKNVTIEFWIKPNGLQDANAISLYGMNTIDFILDSTVSSTVSNVQKPDKSNQNLEINETSKNLNENTTNQKSGELVNAQKYITDKHCDGLVIRLNSLSESTIVNNVDEWGSKIMVPAVSSYLVENFDLEGENLKLAIEECKSCVISRLSGNTNTNTVTVTNTNTNTNTNTEEKKKHEENEKILRAFWNEVEKINNSPQSQEVCNCKWCSSSFTGYGFAFRYNDTPKCRRAYESTNWMSGLCGDYCSPKCAIEACWSK